MTTLPVTRPTSLLAQVTAVLDAVQHVNVFHDRADLPPYAASDASTHRFWDLDNARRIENVHAYAVVYPSPGAATAVLADRVGDTLTWSLQVTCVGGDTDRALWCVEQIRGALTGLPLTTAAGDTVRLTEAEGADPGPIRRDDDTDPPRYYVPLLFTLTA